jgi:hypothetical protein
MKKILLSLFTFIACTTLSGQTNFGSKMNISTTGDTPYTIAAGLVDGDAYNDIIVGTYNDGTLEYYENNGDKTFASAILISNTLNGIGGLKLVDLNNDGFLDLLATAYDSDTVAWYPNDGFGAFPIENIISNTVMGASGFFIGTIDAGVTPDIAVTAYDTNEVVWFSNSGSGVFSGPNTIDNTLTAPGVVKLKDIDNDGDLDALVATGQYNSNNIVQIFRNNLTQTGSVSFTPDTNPVVSGKKFLFNASFEDLDGDTNLDILLTELDTNPGGGAFYWYEFNGTDFTETAFTTVIENPSVAQVKDLDDDGLDDIVLSNGNSGAGVDLVWFKNTGGGVYAAEEVIDDTQSQTYVYAVIDLDNDADLDIASCSYNEDQLNWFENEKYTLNTSNFNSQKVGFYPNPTSNKLYFTNMLNNTSFVEVYNILGKKVIAENVSSLDGLDVSKLKSGLYLLSIDNTSYKFIKD